MNLISSPQRWLGRKLDIAAPTLAIGSAILSAAFWGRGAHIFLDNLAAFLWPALWGSFVVALICSARGKRWIFVVASLAFASNLWILGPWIATTSIQNDSLSAHGGSYPLRIASANVQTSNREYNRVIRWIDDFKPDLLVLIEVDERWLDGVREIERMLPYSMKDPRDHNFGLAVYSRFPILSRETSSFSEEGIQSLNILVNAPGGPVRLLATHALPPTQQSWFLDRNRHLKRLGDWSRSVPEDLIVAGDLNIVPWSTHYAALESGGLRNIRPQSGLLPTWPSFAPHWLRAPIDHVLYRGNFILMNARVGPELGSDHLPLETELSR